MMLLLGQDVNSQQYKAEQLAPSCHPQNHQAPLQAC
jgi:hypothetical protein